MIGEPDNNQGKAYIFYGRSNWAGVDRTNDANIALTGESSGDKFGFTVSSAGNVDNANNDDIIVGAPLNGPNDEGEAYVWYGDGTITSGSPDVTMNGIMNNALFGYSVSSAGDVNNDNYDDVIIGEPDNDRAYIYYGGNPMGGGEPAYFLDNMEWGDNDWTSTPSTNAWERGDPPVPAIAPYSGSYCWETDLDENHEGGDANDWYLDSPEFDLTYATTPYLYFYDWIDVGGGDDGFVQVYYSGSWHTVLTFSADEMTWDQESADISAAAGQSGVRIRFWSNEGGAGTNTNWAIDDVVVKESGATVGADVTLNGENSGDDFGFSVSNAGNVNDATRKNCEEAGSY